MKSTTMNTDKIYNNMVTMSYQSFKLVRGMSKLAIIAGIINVALMILGCLTWQGEIIDPTADGWMAGLSTSQYVMMITMLLIGAWGFATYMAMSHGKTMKNHYKAWCDEHGYKPYNDSKH